MLADNEATAGIGTEATWSVPFTSSPWDEIVPGLWLGCHQYDDGNAKLAKAVVTDEFDLVVSLWSWPGHGPSEGVEEIRFRISDDVLKPDEVTELEDLARTVNIALMADRKVLVRCRAGLNRSALLVAMVMRIQGYDADSAISYIRGIRSPYALCNQYFEWYLRTGEIA